MNLQLGKLRLNFWLYLKLYFKAIINDLPQTLLEIADFAKVSIVASDI